MNTSAEKDVSAQSLQPEAEALTQILAHCPAPLPAEQVSLAEAAGRVLAEPLVSSIQVPQHDNSSMDGYAVRLAELAAGESLPVSQYIAAGSAPTPLAPGSVARIFTGAPLPPGADAVIMQERAQLEGERVLLPREAQTGQNIRRAGEDIERGARILEPGRRLRPQDVGLAASIGIGRVPVRRRLKVALLSTGDELVPAGQALGPAQIYDSNGPMMAALLTQLGYEALGPWHLADEPRLTRDALRRAADQADVIISTGGVSVGEEDHVKAAVEALGALDLWRVAIKPGKPFAFGRVGQTPFLGLPGNPVSVFVTFLLLARPFLARLQGRALEPLDYLALPAAFEHGRPAPQRAEYLRAQLREGQLHIHPHQGSGVLSSTVSAQGLVRLEPGQRVSAGDRVPYIPLSELLF